MPYPEEYDARTACANGLHFFDGHMECVHCGLERKEPIEALLSEEDFPHPDDGLAV